MPLNGKFIEKYGLTWKDMDNDARWQTMMSEIFDLRESVDPVKIVCKVVDRHSLYFTILWIILTLIVVPIGLILLKLWTGA
jgi:hypothetical protein